MLAVTRAPSVAVHDRDEGAAVMEVALPVAPGVEVLSRRQLGVELDGVRRVDGRAQPRVQIGEPLAGVLDARLHRRTTASAAMSRAGRDDHQPRQRRHAALIATPPSPPTVRSSRGTPAAAG